MDWLYKEKLQEFIGFYKKNLPTMLERNNGEYVVIGGPEFYFFKDISEAIKEATEMYKGAPVFIGKVSKDFLESSESTKTKQIQENLTLVTFLTSP